jgi:hypothetical protein
MGESKKRKVHTAEFKAKVGLEALRVRLDKCSLIFDYLHPEAVAGLLKDH